ncbi:unnamed protein product [Triticum turgidum subsp. durum]|uniref:Uncharacterized protein n=1 Tax=Triticum turgidum subsp. durum TaxID=4567 RepID=A0A9R1B8Q8_TRITD|nr:unnamed protein product [Triticum turgidum subsp. durum]
MLCCYWCSRWRGKSRGCLGGLIILSVCARMARQIEGGHGHLTEMVQAVKNHGAGALHFASGCKMAEVCEYLLRLSRWTWMLLTKQVEHLWFGQSLLIKLGHCEIVELLLSRGAYVDLFYMDHGTPLHDKHKQDVTVKIFLDHM